MTSRCAVSILLAAACAACGGGPGTAPDAAAGPPDAHVGPDAPWQDDGPPTRLPCTSSLGTDLSTMHGRLDGYLVAIVPSSARGCNGDADHVHLQVRAGGAVYDVAVNVFDPADVDYLAADMPLVDGAWAEGWHPGQPALLDYPTTLGVHSTDFTPTPKSQLEADLMTELADVNHISVFMTGYGPDGGHLVHRKGTGEDGALFVRPLGGARALLFHFSDQTF
jgi:hypothetical protein